MKRTRPQNPLYGFTTAPVKSFHGFTRGTLVVYQGVRGEAQHAHSTDPRSIFHRRPLDARGAHTAAAVVIDQTIDQARPYPRAASWGAAKKSSGLLSIDRPELSLWFPQNWPCFRGLEFFED